MQAYQILWIDDEHDKQDNFFDLAAQHELYITPYKTSREGMEYLEANMDAVDAVILDAKVFKDSTNEVAKLKGLHSSIKTIAGLEERHNTSIPHVVFTGQEDLESSEDFRDQMDEIPVFSKHTQQDDLIAYIRDSIGDSRNAYFRNKYADIHTFCQQDALTSSLWSSLLPLLKHANEEEAISINPYNEIRKCLELIYRLLHKKKVLHDLLVDKEVNLTLSSLYLAGLPTYEKQSVPPLASKKPILPGLIASNVRYILEVTQGGSHSSDPDKADIADYSIAYLEKYVPEHHLVKCLVPMLLDIITWARAYIIENPDESANQSLWVNLKEDAYVCRGTIRTNRNGYPEVHVDPPSFIHYKLRLDTRLPNASSLADGDKVIVTTEHDDHSKFRNITFINKLP